MSKFIYYTMVVKTRVPIKEDGSLGQPEVISKFISEKKENKATTTKYKRQTKELKSQKLTEEYL